MFCADSASGSVSAPPLHQTRGVRGGNDPPGLTVHHIPHSKNTAQNNVHIPYPTDHHPNLLVVHLANPWTEYTTRGQIGYKNTGKATPFSFPYSPSFISTDRWPIVPFALSQVLHMQYLNRDDLMIVAWWRSPSIYEQRLKPCSNKEHDSSDQEMLKMLGQMALDVSSSKNDGFCEAVFSLWRWSALLRAENQVVLGRCEHKEDERMGYLLLWVAHVAIGKSLNFLNMTCYDRPRNPGEQRRHLGS